MEMAATESFYVRASGKKKDCNSKQREFLFEISPYLEQKILLVWIYLLQRNFFKIS